MELNARRGYLLLLTLLAGGALMFLGVVVLRFVNERNQMTARLEREWVAEGAALAGLERARQALNTDPQWTAGLEVDAPHSRGHASISFAPSAPGGTSASNVSGSQPVTGPDGRVVPPGFVHLVSRGSSGARTFVAEALLCVRGALLDDGFDDTRAAAPAVWTPLRGSSVRVGSGLYTVGGTTESLTCAGDDGWADYLVEAWAVDGLNAAVERNQGAFTLLARLQRQGDGDPQQGAPLAAVQWGYDAVRDVFTFSQGAVDLSHPDAPPQQIARRATALRTLPSAWYRSSFHRFYIRVVNGRVECGVDDTPVVSAPASAARPCGRVGLWVGPNGLWVVDRVKVTNLSGAVYTARW